MFFRSTTVIFKAIRCWLKLKISDKEPRNWVRKRKEIDERIMNLTRCPKKEATIEEIRPGDTVETNTGFDRSDEDKPKVGNLNRIEMDARQNRIPGVLKYNILRRKGNESIQRWKSYPGISKIVEIARKVTEEDDTSNIGNLLQLLQRLRY